MSGALLFIIAAIVVGVNTLSYSYVRKDMTKAEKYTLSEGSGRPTPLDYIGEQIAVDVHCHEGSAEVDAFKADLLRPLQYKATGRKFDNDHRPATEEERKKAKEAGLMKLQRVGRLGHEDKGGSGPGYGLVSPTRPREDPCPLPEGNNNTA